MTLDAGGFSFEDSFAYALGDLTGQGGWTAYGVTDSFEITGSGLATAPPLGDGANIHPLTGLDLQAPWHMEIDVSSYESTSLIIGYMGDDAGNAAFGVDFNSPGNMTLTVYTDAGATSDFAVLAIPLGPFTVNLDWDGTTLSATITATTVSVTPAGPFTGPAQTIVQMVNASMTTPMSLTHILVTQA